MIISCFSRRCIQWFGLAAVALSFHASHGQEPVPAIPPASSVPAADDASIQLQFPNNGINDILGIYELLTGKAVVKESGIFEGKPISLVTAKPVTVTEAVQLIESSLQINGYALTAATDGRSVRVSLATGAQAQEGGGTARWRTGRCICQRTSRCMSRRACCRVCCCCVQRRQFQSDYY